MSDLLTNALLATLEPQIRRIVDERITEALAQVQARPLEHGWLSPPAAAKARSISVKRIRALMESGAVQKRAKVPGPNPKFEISLASLDAALAGDVPAAPAQPINAQSWAAQRAARKAT